MIICWCETTVIGRPIVRQGTYGTVYRGECGGELVAVKVMSLQRDTAEDIKREIKMMRECECDNIVAYRDAFLREHDMRKMLWVSSCHPRDARRRWNPHLRPSLSL